MRTDLLFRRHAWLAADSLPESTPTAAAASRKHRALPRTVKVLFSGFVSQLSQYLRSSVQEVFCLTWCFNNDVRAAGIRHVLFSFTPSALCGRLQRGRYSQIHIGKRICKRLIFTWQILVVLSHSEFCFRSESTTSWRALRTATSSTRPKPSWRRSGRLKMPSAPGKEKSRSSCR